MNLKKIAIIYNPKGGSASEDKIHELANYLESQNIEVLVYATTPAPNSGTILARCCLENESGVDLVIAFGGDGTVCQIAEGLKDSATPMAVYPGGTGNLFARSFYSDPTPTQFARMLLKGHPQPIDVVSTKYKDLAHAKEYSRIFLVGFGLGKLSDAISSASPKLKRYFGRLVYVVRVALACFKPTAKRFRLTATDTNICEDAAVVIVLNVATPLMSTISRGCNASDGLIDVIIFQANTTWQLVKVGFWLLLGRPEHSKYYYKFRTKELTIQCGSNESMLPNIDGDPGVATRAIHLKVEPNAVQMILS